VTIEIGVDCKDLAVGTPPGRRQVERPTPMSSERRSWPPPDGSDSRTRNSRRAGHSGVPIE